MTGARAVAAILAAAAIALSPSLGHAANPKPGDRHPDWFGSYMMASGADLAGFKNENQENIDAVIKAHLQPWARLKMEQTNGVADDTGATCGLDGIFRLWLRSGGFTWVPNGNQILMISYGVYSGGVRRFYLDRPHTKYPPPTWNGQSVARWEGQTLVVDTIGFNDKSWLMSAMEPHTEALHVVERIRMAAPELLEIHSVVEDRLALTSPYTFTLYFKRTGDEYIERVCSGEPGEQREWAAWQQKAIKAGMRPAPPR